ncbi:MAG TPA: ABC transporter permease [Candidatus Angelobacter sp.]|nr:ABC transporter permease [Candidatus Angelobacter sp.]
MARRCEFLRKFLFLLQRKQLERDLQEEIEGHLWRKAEKNVSAGMSREAAYASARRQLGNLTRHREESRTSWGFPLLESIVQDTRYGLRVLGNAPGFATVAILTLALGIGASSAIFSITNAVLLRPLPYKDSPRLVHVWGKSARFPEFSMGMSYPDAEDLRAKARSFETVAWYRSGNLVLTGAGEPEQAPVAAVSSDFLRLFSVQPALGSGFQPDDYEMKNGRVILLGYGLWQRRFAADSSIVGRTVTFDGVPYTVTGVLPKDFSYADIDALVPLIPKAEEKTKRENWMFFTLAKMRPSVSARTAQAEADSFQAGLAQAYPKEESDSRLEVQPLLAAAVNGDTTTQLATLVGAVSFLLLIGCANVSNLILSRSVQRQREIALRAALGASRARILRQLLIESLVLALTGGVAGMALASIGIRAFRVLSPPTFSRLSEIRFEPVVALIALLVACAAGIICGLAPALHTSRADLNLALKERSAFTSLTHRFSLRSFLVVAEVSLALALLTGSALLVQSLARLMKVDTGFRTDHLLTAQIEMSPTRYASEDARRLFIQRIFEALRAEPQFRGVALANNSLLTHMTAVMSFDPELIGIHEKPTPLEAKSVSPGFFEALNIPMLAGRGFTDRDVKGSPPVVVISQSLAKRFYPAQEPLGKVFKVGTDPADAFQVVGVVADTRDIHLGQKLQPQVYFPILQDPYNGMSVMVRSGADPLTLVRLLQQRVWSVDKDQPLTHVNSMSEVIANSVAEPRFKTWLLSAFAAAGLALTLIGIYGVISYSVNQRARELGIRLALGAQSGDVLGLVLKQGLGMAVTGAGIGVLGSLALMRLLATQLYGIKPTDPLTLAGSAMLLLVVAVCASYIPARRATKADPMIALRAE